MATTFASIAKAELVKQGMTENNANAAKVTAWLNEQQAKQRAIFFGYNADARIVGFFELTGGYWGPLSADVVSTPIEIVPLAKIAAWRYMFDHLADTTPAPNGAVRKDAPNSTPMSGWPRKTELAEKIGEAYRVITDLAINIGTGNAMVYGTITDDGIAFDTQAPLQVGDTITIGAETATIAAETVEGKAYTLSITPALQGEQAILFQKDFSTYRIPAIGIWHVMGYGGWTTHAPQY